MTIMFIFQANEFLTLIIATQQSWGPPWEPGFFFGGERKLGKCSKIKTSLLKKGLDMYNLERASQELG